MSMNNTVIQSSTLKVSDCRRINVQVNKHPIQGLAGWQKKSKEWCDKYYDSSKPTAIITGLQQHSGKYVLGLDFDIMCKEFEEQKKETNELFMEFARISGSKDGFFNTSTCGNYGVLVDVSENDSIVQMLQSPYARCRMNKDDLELLNGQYCIVPNSGCTCGIHGKVCSKRKFMGDNHFHKPNKDTEKFIIDRLLKYDARFAEVLGDDVSEKKTAPEKTIKIQKKKKGVVSKSVLTAKYPPLEKKSEDDVEHADDDMLSQLGDLIPVFVLDKYDDWIKIVWSLASAKRYTLAVRLSKKSKKYKDGDCEVLFKTFDGSISIGTFLYYCRQANEAKYLAIRRKHFDIDLFFTEHSVTTNSGVAYVVNYLIGEQLIYKPSSKSLFRFNGTYWQEDKGLSVINKFVRNDVRKFYKSLIKQLMDKDEDGVSKKGEQLMKCLNSLGGTKFVEDTIKCVCHDNADDTVEFDTKPNLFAFNNAVYDLDAGAFIKPEPSQYVSITTGYDYVAGMKSQRDVIMKIFDDIFPEKEERDAYMTILSTGMHGQVLEKFVIANGEGRNGKSLTSVLMRDMLGNYGLKSINDILLQPMKQGSNPQLAEMRNKRMIFYEEPNTSDNQKINISTVKELTGGSEINARSVYSSDTKTKLCATHICECNDKPKISGNPSDTASRKRIIDVMFGSTFVSAEDLEEEKEMAVDASRVKVGDAKYKTELFRKIHKYALFDILCGYYTNYKNNKFSIDKFIPDSIKKRSLQYIRDSNELQSWFDETYEKKDGAVVKLADVYGCFRDSEYYQNLNKADKRTMNKKWLVDTLKKSPFLRKYYKDCYKPVVDGKQRKFRTVLVGWAKVSAFDDDGDISE